MKSRSEQNKLVIKRSARLHQDRRQSQDAKAQKVGRDTLKVECVAEESECLVPGSFYHLRSFENVSFHTSKDSLALLFAASAEQIGKRGRKRRVKEFIARFQNR